VSGGARSTGPLARRRGFALADFIAGTVILAGAVSAWVAITRAQLDATRHADQRGKARNAALLALDDARLEGATALRTASGPADKNGFRLVRTFAVPGLPVLVSREPQGRLEARELPVEGDTAGGSAIELRATITWRAEHGTDSLELSTALGGEK